MTANVVVAARYIVAAAVVAGAADTIAAAAAASRHSTPRTVARVVLKAGILKTKQRHAALPFD